jgi:hypothetical protein
MKTPTGKGGLTVEVNVRRSLKTQTPAPVRPSATRHELHPLARR